MTGAYFVIFMALCLGYVQNEPLRATETAFVEDMRAGNNRIIAGWPAADGQFPYQISLRMVATTGGVSSCGGSIIQKTWIITAAHCLANRVSFVVRLGLTNLTRPEWMVETTIKHIHPLYDEIRAGVQTDDIALLGLEQEITYGPTVQPIRLQNSGQKNDVYTRVLLTVSGYGRTVDGGSASETLNWVHLRGISNEECRGFYGSVVQQQTICAEYYNNTAQSSCQGDSGGPLTFVDADGTLTQIGIVSFGSAYGCDSIFPSAYVRPGHYHDWFARVTGLNLDWSSADLAASEQPSIDESINIKGIAFDSVQ